MPAPHDPRQNHLLRALPAADAEPLFPHLELVPMPLGNVLYESGGTLRHVYFPTTPMCLMNSAITLHTVFLTCADAPSSVYLYA